MSENASENATLSPTHCFKLERLLHLNPSIVLLVHCRFTSEKVYHAGNEESTIHDLLVYHVGEITVHILTLHCTFTSEKITMQVLKKYYSYSVSLS